jgi:hypothetical protein
VDDVSRLGKLIERLNRWLAPAAVGASVEQTTGQSASSVNAVGVKAIITEIEEPEQPADDEPR